MASQRALTQGMDLSGFTRASETLAKTLASQRALTQGTNFQNFLEIPSFQIEQEEAMKDTEDENEEE